MKLLILKGIQGSGKSTWAKKFVTKNKNWVRINRDDLRNMRGEYWVPKQEDLITSWEDGLIEQSLNSGYNVILDSMNLNQDRNNQRVNTLLTQFPELEVNYKIFNISLEEAIKRDLMRPNSMGHEIITQTYNKYFGKEKNKYVEDSSLPSAIIVDIDGTLSTMVNRGPYEWLKVDQDFPIEPTINLIKKFKTSHRIILMSGRDNICRDLTIKWLEENGVYFDDLFMRPENNVEKDSVIKSDLFEERIRGKYFVEFVVDDRKQVKKMWVEEKGLFVFDVNQHDRIF